MNAVPTKPSSDAGLDTKAVIAAAVTVVLWASAFLSIRSTAAHFSPGALAQGRMVTAALALLVIWLIRRGGLPSRHAWPGIAISGVVWFAGYMVLLNWGEQQVDAGTASMLVNIGPILMAVFGGILLKEGFPRNLVIGVVVAFAGTLVVGFSSANATHITVLGVLLCVAAAVCYASGVVSQKTALRYATPLQATTFGAVIGAIVCSGFSAQLVGEIRAAPMSATANMVYLGLFPTAIAFSTWAYALSRTTAGRMGATTYAVPAVVVLGSWLLLNEVPTGLACVGGALCLLGVAISRLRQRPKAPTPRAPVVKTSA